MCGFCTPGFVMSISACLDATPGDARRDPARLRGQLVPLRHVPAHLRSLAAGRARAREASDGSIRARKPPRDGQEVDPRHQGGTADTRSGKRSTTWKPVAAVGAARKCGSFHHCDSASTGRTRSPAARATRHDMRLPGMATRVSCAARIRAGGGHARSARRAKMPGVVLLARSWREHGEVARSSDRGGRGGDARAGGGRVRAIVATYEVLPFALTPEQALAEARPRSQPRQRARARTNTAISRTVEAALAGRAAKSSGAWRLPVQHHACLETHGVVVDYRGGDEATVYASTQGTFTIPGDAAGDWAPRGKVTTSSSTWAAASARSSAWASRATPPASSPKKQAAGAPDARPRERVPDAAGNRSGA
jgi:hypothetical protein